VQGQCYAKLTNMKPVYLRPECKGEDIQWLHDILKARHSDTSTKPTKCTAEEGSLNVVGGCGGCRTPDESWLDMESAKDEETFFIYMVVEEEDEGKHEEDVLKPQEEYKDQRASKEGARQARDHPQCISDEEL
jgi:hypothetical protein